MLELGSILETSMKIDLASYIWEFWETMLNGGSSILFFIYFMNSFVFLYGGIFSTLGFLDYGNYCGDR